jgi:predicted permease
MNWIESISNDLRYSLRMLRRQPLSNGIIVLTMALLIGALSVLYTAERDGRAAWAPFPDVGRIVSLWRVSERSTIVMFSEDLFHGYQEGISSFEALGAIRPRKPMTLTGVGEPASYRPLDVTKEVFEITRPRAVRGRLFAEEEYTEASDNLVIISEQMWREKLDADTNIIGSDLVLDDRACKVIGVMPAAMRTTCLGFNTDIWRPMRVDQSHQSGRLRLIGKLKPGATLKQAQAEMDVIAPRLEAQHTVTEWEKLWGSEGFESARVVPVTANVYMADNNISRELIFAFVFAGLIVVCVVGITCFNITNLLLARFSTRSREVSIRLSLGAGRLRIVRQLLSETMLLALLGGVFGLLASFWFSDLLRLHHIDPKVDWRLHLLAFSGTVALGILVGLVPAIRSSRKDLTESLKEGGATVGGRSRHRLRDFLVASEVGMASILCLVSAMMTRNALEYYRGDLGFKPDRLVCVGIQPRGDRGWDHAHQVLYAERGLQALREMSGVERASVCAGHYFTRLMPKETITLPSPTGSESAPIQIALSRVTPDYLDMFGMPVVRGRFLSETVSGGSGEVLVNETFAARYFPDRDPIGRQIRFKSEPRRMTIVGVTRDRHHRMSYAAIEPEIFCDFRSSFSGLNLMFVAQTRAKAKVMAAPVRDSIARIDISQPVPPAEIISDVLARRSADVKGPMISMALLAGVGLLIALAGVYGVVSFSVVERTREVGIRMAVGATKWEILRLMLWQGARLMLLGAPLGIVFGTLILLAAPASAGFVDISAVDLPTSVVVILLVGLVGVCACLFPARRAIRVHPMNALRYE